MTYRVKLLLATVGLALLTGSLAVAFSYFWAGRVLVEQIRSNVLSIAVSAAALVDGDAHETVRNRGEESGEAYRAIESALRDFRDLHRRDDVHVAFVYTFRPSAADPDRWEYIVDAEEAGDDKSAIGDPFEFEAEVSQDAVHRLSEGPDADDDFTHDEFGSWLSADAPVFDGQGNPVARLGVDIEATAVVAQRRELLQNASYGLLAGLAAAIGLGLVLSSWANRPLKEIGETLGRIGAGDLDARLPVTRKDEFGLVQKAVNTMAQSLQQRDALAGALTRYVSQDVAEDVLEQQDSVRVRGEHRRITLLFCNIRGFSKLSERLEPAESVQLLNEFFAEMIEVVFANGGTMDKFIGDGLMATFGSQADDDDQERHAIDTAIGMCRELRSLQAKWKRDGLPAFQIGIGIHTGDALVGRMGSAQHMDRTAIGEAVNTAAMIEAYNMALDSTCLVSAATREPVKDDYRFIEQGTVTPPGSPEPITLYTIASIEGFAIGEQG